MSSKWLILPLVVAVIAATSVKAEEGVPDVPPPSAEGFPPLSLLQNGKNRQMLRGDVKPVPSVGREGKISGKPNIEIPEKLAKKKTRPAPGIQVARGNKDHGPTKATHELIAPVTGPKADACANKCQETGYKCVEKLIKCDKPGCPPLRTTECVEDNPRPKRHPMALNT